MTERRKNMKKMNNKINVKDTNDPDINPYPCDPIWGANPLDDDGIESLLQDMGTERHSKTLFRDEIIREICAIFAELVRCGIR